MVSLAESLPLDESGEATPEFALQNSKLTVENLQTHISMKSSILNTLLTCLT
jgi:hypothetical protein